jgi:hypothetical protein
MFFNDVALVCVSCLCLGAVGIGYKYGSKALQVFSKASSDNNDAQDVTDFNFTVTTLSASRQILLRAWFVNTAAPFIGLLCYAGREAVDWNGASC